MVYSAYPSPVLRDVSNTEAFSRLMHQSILFKPKYPDYQPLELSIKQITEFSSWYFSRGLNVDLPLNPSLFGSKVTHLFADGPMPNDTDIEIEIPECLREMDKHKMQCNIQHWLNLLVHESATVIYGCSIKPIPNNKGWVINLNDETQIVLKYPSQQLHGLSVMDGLKVSLNTGLLSMQIGDRLITDPIEFDQLIQKIKVRDVENGVSQDFRAVGRIYRVLHYLGHGAKLKWEDLSLDEVFRDITANKMQEQYVRHLENHFPTLTGKLVDFLNFLTLIKEQPSRCQQVSHIVWTARERLRFAPCARLAYCVQCAPQLTPYLLKFIHGALLHDLVSKNGLSSVRAWYLPFLEKEIRPFFMIDCQNMYRYLAMDCPGKEQTPDALVLEFFRAWDHLEKELPKAGFQLIDFFNILTTLGISPTVLSPANRQRIEEELASISTKPHLQHYYDHFSSDQLFKTKKSCILLFKSSLHSPRVSPEGQLYAQKRLKEASAFAICLPRQDALLYSHQFTTAKKCSSDMVAYLRSHGHFPSLFNACLNEPRMYHHIFMSLLDIDTIPPEMTTKLCGVLKETHSKLGKESHEFRKGWVKAAMELHDPEINRKYITLLKSGKFFKTDPLAILFELQRQMRQSAKQAARCFQTLQTQKKSILMLTNGKKTLFSDRVLKLLPARNAAQVPFIEKMITFIDKCHVFSAREKDEVYQVQAHNASLLGPSQLSSALLEWISFRQHEFGSAFALPIAPVMKAICHFPVEVQTPLQNLLQDLLAQTPEQQMRILHEVMPFFDSPAREEELLMGSRLLRILKDPGYYQQQVNRKLQQIYECRALWAQTQKRKKSVPKEHKFQEFTSKTLGKVKLDSEILSKVFKEKLRKHLPQQMDECLTIAEQHLNKISLSSFKERVLAAIQLELSYPDPLWGSERICQFIRHTTELLPIFLEFFPRKAFLRIDGLTGKFEKASKQFPSEISTLVFKAKAGGLKCKPRDWYRFHTTAARFHIDSAQWKNEHVEVVLEHIQEADLAVCPKMAKLEQRKEMIHVHRGFAIHFLKRALKGFAGTPDWLKFYTYIEGEFMPYMTHDKYKSDQVGTECVLDVFIALSGIPAIFKALSKISDKLLKGTKVQFAKSLAKHKDDLPKVLTEYGYDQFLKLLTPSQRDALLAHVIDMLSLVSEKDVDLFGKMKTFTIHRQLCNRLSFLFMFLQQGGVFTKAGVKFVSQLQIGNYLANYGNLMTWDTYCASVSLEDQPRPTDLMSGFFSSVFQGLA